MRAAQGAAAAPPVDGADPPPRFTLKRLVAFVRERFGLSVCRETIRAALHRLALSWKKAKKLLGRADPEQRQAFIDRLPDLLAGAQRDRHLLVYLDEAHIHQDTDLGHGWCARGERLWVASSSPGLSAKVSFYGLYLYNEGEVRLWPYARANGEHTIEVLRRLRAEVSDRKIILLWDGAPYHRAQAVRAEASDLNIALVPLPGYSPDLMPVEALWRWLREDVTYHHCHSSPEISPDASPLSKPASTRIHAPWPIASGSRISSTPRRKNYGSQNRRGLDWTEGLFCETSRGIMAILTRRIGRCLPSYAVFWPF